MIEIACILKESLFMKKIILHLKQLNNPNNKNVVLKITKNDLL